MIDGFGGGGSVNLGMPVAVSVNNAHRAGIRLVEAMMGISRTIGLLLVLSGLGLISACAPPTPKVEPSVAPPVIQKEPVAPVHNSDGSFRRTV
jgi:hypothetical protein